MKVSEYYDTPIYSDKGNYVGEVQDVVLNLDEGKIFGLGFGKEEDRVATIPYESVMAVGDIVIVQSKKARQKVQAPEEPES